ncbi:MAG: transporter substrate-binding domain-containing protein [Cyanobacteria bacterium J06632_3]
MDSHGQSLPRHQTSTLKSHYQTHQTLKYIASRDPNAFELVGGLLSQEDYGIAFKESTDGAINATAEAVNQEILALQERGYLRLLREKWFGSEQQPVQ